MRISDNEVKKLLSTPSTEVEAIVEFYEEVYDPSKDQELIAKVKSQYDLVFFDSPPILGVSDGSVLASEVDITIMVQMNCRRR